MQIAIVGCGYAGGAAALFLHRAGHDVAVFEAVADPEPIGAGILIQPTGLAVLARLGLLEKTLARASRVDGLRVGTVSGRELMNLRYADLSPDWHGAGLHRGAIFQSLVEAVRAEVESLHFGTRIVDAKPHATGGSSLIEDDGRRHGPFELVIVADGARSQIRDTWRHGKVTTYRWGAAWYVGPDPENRYAGELYQTVDGTRKMMGLLPTGLGPTRPGSADTPQVSLYWSLHEDAVDQWRSRGLTAFKDEIRAYDAHAAPLMDQVDDMDELLFAQYHRVIMRPWYRDGVLFIGDAAHAMSPQLGQGTNLALVDAMVLGDCVHHAAAAGRSAAAACRAYVKARRPQLAYYELAAHALTPLFQSSLPGLGIARDLLFVLLSNLPWVSGQMLATMCGVKRGIVRPKMSLELPLPLPPPGA